VTHQPSRTDEIAARLWEELLELSPLTATVYGDTRFDDRLDDPGPAGRAATIAAYQRAVDDMAAVPESELDLEDRITRDVAGRIADLEMEGEAIGAHEIAAVNQIDGPQTILAQIAIFQQASTPEGLERWLQRLRAYGPFLEASTQILREGLASGRTSSRVVAELTVAQLESLSTMPAEKHPVTTACSVADDEARRRVAEVVRDVIQPADARYLAVLRDEYLAHTRELPGLASAPDGEAQYRHAIRAWTSLDIAPAEVHAIGLAELEALNAERRELARAAGYGADVDAYRRALDADPANHAASTEELIARAVEDIGRANEAAPRVFGRLPRAACEVRPVEEFKEQVAPFAYYFPPTPDGSRSGTYYVNTYDLPSRTYTKLASTTYHEATPGHHFQITLEMEDPSLNVFRRLGSRRVGGAYVEGWGLYAERLADELGLYRNPGERMGMLDAQAWRASRLVVDSGLHGLGWTRQQSVDWLLDTGLSATDANIETDRYIGWPGQALCYMLGLREIRRLRQELEARDGAAFDLRRFHDEVIGHGSLPLATLAKELPGWVPAAR
jgi:uncharacterized protein (DUF885 family)